MKDGFRLYDTHTHLGTALHSGRQHTAEAMLRQMDALGIDRSVLIPFPVAANYAAEHDLIAAAVESHPDRFTGCMYWNPFDTEAGIRAELRRGVDMGLRALKLQPQFSGLNPMSPRASAFFGLANEFKLPVICHTGAGAPFALPSLFIAPAREYPSLTIVLGHCGSPIYFQEAIIAAQVCPNIVLEVSSLIPHQVLDVLRHVDASRVMAGSDLPESAEYELGKVIGLDIAAEARRQVLWSTGRRVFDGVVE